MTSLKQEAEEVGLPVLRSGCELGVPRGPTRSPPGSHRGTAPPPCLLVFPLPWREQLVYRSGGRVTCWILGTGCGQCPPGRKAVFAAQAAGSLGQGPQPPRRPSTGALRWPAAPSLRLRSVTGHALKAGVPEGTVQEGKALSCRPPHPHAGPARGRGRGVLAHPGGPSHSRRSGRARPSGGQSIRSSWLSGSWILYRRAADLC